MFKAIFYLNEAQKIRITKYNKGWTNVAITKDLDKIREQVIE